MTDAKPNNERRIFLSIAQKFYFASYRGFSKHLDRDVMVRRATKLAIECWAAIIPYKDKMPGDQWSDFKNAVPACSANLLAAHPDLEDDILIREGIADANALWDALREAPF